LKELFMRPSVLPCRLALVCGALLSMLAAGEPWGQLPQAACGVNVRTRAMVLANARYLFSDPSTGASRARQRLHLDLVSASNVQSATDSASCAATRAALTADRRQYVPAYPGNVSNNLLSVVRAGRFWYVYDEGEEENVIIVLDSALTRVVTRVK
jgi:hypothetical protein